MRSRGSKVRLKSSVASLFLLVVAGCGDGEERQSAVEITLTREGGASPTSFHVVYGSNAADVRGLDCPSLSATHSSLECTERGFRIGNPSSSALLVVKSPGDRFLTQTLGPKAIRAEAIPLLLERLHAVEDTDAYVTGFSHDESERAAAEARFASLAVTSTTELGRVSALKFYVSDFDGAPRVYFQNTRRFPLHYGFARDVLHVGVTPAQFENAVYHGAQRTAVAGTLLDYSELELPADGKRAAIARPIVLQLFPEDDLEPGTIRRLALLLEERLGIASLSGNVRRLVYVPSSVEREREAEGATNEFALADVIVRRQADLYAGISEQLLNRGVAYGTLRVATQAALVTEPFSVRDIVVLERLPNELPLLGGTITEELQTPLSHVNVAARARGTPNLALRNARKDPRLAPYFDCLVRFEVRSSGFSIAAATTEEAEAFWNSNAREPLVPKSDLSMTGFLSFEEMGFEDSIRVGAKAANLGLLRQLLGDVAPSGFAVPFSAYHDYLSSNRVTYDACERAMSLCSQRTHDEARCERARPTCIASAESDRTFEEHIRFLIGDAEFGADTRLRQVSLLFVESLLREGTVDPAFATSLDARVRERFGDAQVRLRSSTNAEDLPEFSGAGSYVSVSATSDGEKAASRRIREVWASVWSFKAFEERAFWNIEHLAVMMGVAVNPAVDGEVVNGVIISDNLLSKGATGYYVNVQAGEVSVTNPEGGAVPEIVTIDVGTSEPTVIRQRYSSLSPNRALMSDEELAQLARTVQGIVSHFAPLYGKPESALALDLEFKLVGKERRLLIKQVRPYNAPTQ
ncbi:MAG: PEP/pyruvate-binding domain-containing protein [Polyangiaceae bacterium]